MVTNILDSAVSDSGAIKAENLFELDKYEVKPQPQAQAQTTQNPAMPANPVSEVHGLDSSPIPVTQTQEIPLEPSVDAMAYTELADTIVTRIMVFGCHMMDKKGTVADFALTSGEKKKIAPLVGKVVEKYLLTMSVEMQLAIMALAMYGGRYLAIATDPDRDLKAVKKKPKIAFEGTADNAKPEGARGRGRPRKL